MVTHEDFNYFSNVAVYLPNVAKKKGKIKKRMPQLLSAALASAAFFL